MPINAHPDFLAAEKEYHQAQTLEEKLITLKKMISKAPSHKGAENLRQQLTTRRKKLQNQISKAKKSGKSSKTGIKKEDMQAVIIGFTNTGKSSLLSALTNAHPKISEIQFTTKYPIIGMMNYETINMQLIENPSIESEFFDKGLANTADTILILITNLDQIKEIESKLTKSCGKRLIVFNNKNKLSENELRKISATLQSKKYNFVIINTKTQENLEEEVIGQRQSLKKYNDFSMAELKNKMFLSFDKIRVYTKEPRKEKTKKPIILKPGSTVKDVAEKILKGFSEKVKETKIWGPSSKFSGQKIGLQHKLKDLDVVEFKTK